MRYLQRAFSFRILMAALFAGLIAAVLTAFVWEAAVGVVFVVVTGGVWVLAVLNEENVPYCPHCGKRVKLGSGTCHHCGRDVRAAAAASGPSIESPARPTPRYPPPAASSTLTPPPAASPGARVLLTGSGEFEVSAVGESNYVAALLRAAGGSRDDEEIEADVNVRLVREPQNPYDPNAVAVVSEQGRKLAYLCREDAEDYAEALDELGGERELWCRARIGGGRSSGHWRIGVTLDLDPPGLLEQPPES